MHFRNRLTFQKVWLILDIGNTAVKGGVFEDDLLVQTFQLDSDPAASVPAYRHSLRAYLQGIPLDRVGIVSVVPVLTAKLTEAVRQEKMVLPEVLHPGLRLPLSMGYKTPQTLGVDRLALAVAAYARYGTDTDETPRDVLVVSGGTAVTYEAVSKKGVYLGGAIGSGPALVRNALSNGTAQLPAPDLELPRRPIGRSTRHSLQSGIMYGFIDSVSGMLQRLAAQLRSRPYVIATGGWGSFLAEHIEHIDHVDPSLGLYGGFLVLKMN